MIWEDKCYLLSKRKFRENASIINIFTQKKGKIDGMAYRVPVPDGSVVDLALELDSKATVEDINKVMKEASETYLKDLLQYSTEPIVSVDIIGNPYSGIYDAPLTRVIKDNSATCNPEITPSDRDFKTKLFSRFLSITELLVISPCWPRSS